MGLQRYLCIVPGLSFECISSDSSGILFLVRVISRTETSSRALFRNSDLWTLIIGLFTSEHVFNVLKRSAGCFHEKVLSNAVDDTHNFTTKSEGIQTLMEFLVGKRGEFINYFVASHAGNFLNSTWPDSRTVPLHKLNPVKFLRDKLKIPKKFSSELLLLFSFRRRRAFNPEITMQRLHSAATIKATQFFNLPIVIWEANFSGGVAKSDKMSRNIGNSWTFCDSDRLITEWTYGRHIFVAFVHVLRNL